MLSFSTVTLFSIATDLQIQESHLTFWLFLFSFTPLFAADSSDGMLKLKIPPQKSEGEKRRFWPVHLASQRHSGAQILLISSSLEIWPLMPQKPVDVPI